MSGCAVKARLNAVMRAVKSHILMGYNAALCPPGARIR